MPARYQDWLRQAKRDLDHAKRSLENGDYIPPRYPNSYPEGAPFDYYTREEASRAIANTTAILAFCEGVLAEPESGADVPEGSGDATGGETPGN